MTYFKGAARRGRFVLAITVLAGVGCTGITPPGRYQDEDFSWEAITLPTSYLTAYRRLMNGFRQCHPTTGNVFFPTRVGVPNCFDDRERQVVLCDVYAGAMRATSNRVLGRIELSAAGDKETSAKIGVVRHAAGAQLSTTRSIWLAFLREEQPCAD